MSLINSPLHPQKSNSKNDVKTKLLIPDFFLFLYSHISKCAKWGIKEALHTELVKQNILPGGSVVTGVATTALSDDLEAAEAE